MGTWAYRGIGTQTHWLRSPWEYKVLDPGPWEYEIDQWNLGRRNPENSGRIGCVIRKEELECMVITDRREESKRECKDKWWGRQSVWAMAVKAQAGNGVDDDDDDYDGHGFMGRIWPWRISHLGDSNIQGIGNISGNGNWDIDTLYNDSEMTEPCGVPSKSFESGNVAVFALEIFLSCFFLSSASLYPIISISQQITKPWRWIPARMNETL